MSYNIHLTYLDKEKLNIALTLEDSERFFECLKSGEVFWGNSEKKSGIWIPVEEIRYAQISKLEEPVKSDPLESELS